MTPFRRPHLQPPGSPSVLADCCFDFAVSSDHYQPWLTSQGHAWYAWSILGTPTAAAYRADLREFLLRRERAWSGSSAGLERWAASASSITRSCACCETRCCRPLRPRSSFASSSRQCSTRNQPRAGEPWWTIPPSWLMRARSGSDGAESVLPGRSSACGSRRGFVGTCRDVQGGGRR